MGDHLLGALKITGHYANREKTCVEPTRRIHRRQYLLYRVQEGRYNRFWVGIEIDLRVALDQLAQKIRL